MPNPNPSQLVRFALWEPLRITAFPQPWLHLWASLYAGGRGITTPTTLFAIPSSCLVNSCFFCCLWRRTKSKRCSYSSVLVAVPVLFRNANRLTLWLLQEVETSAMAEAWPRHSAFAGGGRDARDLQEAVAGTGNVRMAMGLKKRRKDG